MLYDKDFEWLRDLTKNSNRLGTLLSPHTRKVLELYHESECKCLTGRRLGTLSAVKKPAVTLFTDVPARGSRKRGDMMKATQLLHNLGQSLWLDNITRDLLNSGTLKRYIDELSVTGLTSNPTIFDHAIKNSTAYDAAIREKLSKGKSGEALFFELALEDITRAASLFRPVYDRTDGVDGWVSLEVSPLLAYDTASTLAAAKDLHARAGRPNLFIKIPGTKEGLPAIEEAIFAGIPINVTLLFSREHYVSAAEAFLRGIERRIEAGLKPGVGSVASVFISRWDSAVMGKVPDSLRDQLGIAIAKRTYLRDPHEIMGMLLVFGIECVAIARTISMRCLAVEARGA
jgi:transaldolase